MSCPRAASCVLAVWALAALLWPGLGAAQADWVTPPGRLPFVTYGAEVGFGSWSVEALAQDERGHLWVGGEGGLFRYDGSRFRAVEGEACSGIIRQIVAGRGGVLWCLTVDGLARRSQGRWEAVGVAQGPVSMLAVDGQGRLWLTTAGGLLRERESGGFELVPGWPGGPAEALWVSPSGEVYTGRRGVLRRLGGDGQWREWRGLPNERLQAVAGDKAGRLWLMDARRLWSLSPQSGALSEWTQVVAGRMPSRMLTDRHGTLWVGTSQGLMSIEEDGVPRPAPGVPGGRVLVIFEDREGSLWVGGNGLHRLTGRGLWRTYGRHEGLPAEITWAIRRDGAGTLWAATSEGLARATAAGWEVEPAVPRMRLNALLIALDGALWLGGASPEVLRFDPHTRRLERYPLGESTTNSMVYDLVEDQAGTLWAATSLGAFRRERGLALVRVPLPGAPEGENVRDVLVDSQGRLWLGAERGLVLYEGGSFRRLGREAGLRGNHTAFLAERRGGELCVSYLADARGASCFRWRGQRLEQLVHFDKRSGLSGDVVYLLGEDEAGRLWVGTGQGLDVIVDRQVVVSHSAAEGLPDDDIAAWSFWADVSGDVWLGTRQGMARYLNRRETEPLPPPEVVLDAVRVGEQSLPLQGTRVPSLPHDQSTLAFELAVPRYVDASRIEREVRLLGLEEEFRREVQVSTQYARLPPGRYEFQARARYRHGAWGPVASYGLEIRPPFWSTWWFRLAGVAAGVGLLALVLAWQKRALRRRNAELERLVAERTRELREAQAHVVRLEKAATEQQMAGGFAHEVRNALTGAKVLLGALHEQGEESLCVENSGKLKELFLRVRPYLPEEARREVAMLLKEINANEEQIDGALQDVGSALGRALSLTQVLLEYARLGRERPGTQAVSLRALAEAVLTESRSELEAHAIQVELRLAPEAELEGTEAHLYSMLKNLVLNAKDAMRDKPGPRRLRLELRQEGEQQALIVEDTGVGIAPEHRERIFEPFFSTKPRTGTGLGLGMVKRLVELYGGTIHVESELGEGARFTVRLPRRQQAVA